MHPNHAHATRGADDPDQALERRLEIARQSGVPEAPLRAWADRRRAAPMGFERVVLPDRPLVEGVEVETDLGTWRVIETPGHAPSHVCLHQPERRLLISGDHLLGRVSLYYDYGYSPDPVGEFLDSLDKVDALDVRLSLSGHGKPFTDARGHIDANRALVAERLDAAAAALDGAELTAFDVAPRVHPAGLTAETAPWLITETLACLTHLERTGRARRIEGADGEPDRWTAA
jgi:glyoxylase-like metal-dependent hydrolase (beta-lactamase superfamily II)